ncbi:MAG: hypothetical protein WEB60_04765 [Terrimicrobiaceae bacterium]
MTRTAHAFSLILAAAAFAGSPAHGSMTKDDLASVEKLDAVTIPMPGEFFTAMGKVGQPAWGQHLRVGSPGVTDSRSLIALGLGTLVADGYVAVEAQDGQAIKNIGKEILALAKKLNLSQSVLGRSNSISDFADNNDWNALREELEATQNEVKLDMVDQNDDRLVTLVSLGAWIRGVDLVSGMVTKEYSPAGAKLLRQPAIIEYLLTQIDALPESARSASPLPEIRAGLESSLPLVEPEVPSAGQIASLHKTMKALFDLINGSAPTP